MKKGYLNKFLIFGIFLMLVTISFSPSILGEFKDNKKVEIFNQSKTLNSINKNNICIFNQESDFIYNNKIEKSIFKTKEKLYNFLGLEPRLKYINKEYKKICNDIIIKNPIFSAGNWNFTIKGYITDAENNNPIEGAEVLVIAIDRHETIKKHLTYSLSNGYYELDINNPLIYDSFILFQAEEYFSYIENVYYIINNNLIWFNTSLDPGAPPKNSKVCGHVFNYENLEPIEGATVNLIWRDYDFNVNWYITSSDSSGFYSFNSAAGDAYTISEADGYYLEFAHLERISEGQTSWINNYLNQMELVENAKVCGYITEEISGDPIKDVLIDVFSINFDISQATWNYTMTDSSGYYEINVGYGEIQIDATLFDYALGNNYRFDIDEGETYWWNSTLFKIPPETAIVCGNLTDMDTGEFLDHCLIDYFWFDEDFHYMYKFTYSDDNGFYKFSTPPGTVYLSVWPFHENYFGSGYDIPVIDENETIWADIKLEPHPPENSVIQGFVKSNNSFDPIDGDSGVQYATVDFEWKDNDGYRWYWNYTRTDEKGYYKINIAAGKFDFWCGALGHYFFDSGEYTIDDFETKTIDILLDPVKLDVNIRNPKPGVYLNNKYLFDLFTILSIGKININVNGSENLNEVEFYINGEYKGADPKEPYLFNWDERAFGRYKITVSCNGDRDRMVNKDLIIWKFF